MAGTCVTFLFAVDAIVVSIYSLEARYPLYVSIRCFFVELTSKGLRTRRSLISLQFCRNTSWRSDDFEALSADPGLVHSQASVRFRLFRVP